MVFDIKNKVAIITGGAGGIGKLIAEELLKKGAKGICIADISESDGETVVNDLRSKFGQKQVIFSKTDVTNYQEFEGTFKKTVDHFGAIDMLFNNAGIFNDGSWQREIDINVKGVVNGIILAFDHYIPKYKSGDEGIIINTCSIAGISPLAICPVYSGTKFAVLGLTLSFGSPVHYERTKVKMIGICPGNTNTPVFKYCDTEHLGEPYRKLYTIDGFYAVAQEPSILVEGMMDVVQKAENQTIWVIEDGQPPYEWKLPDRKSFAPAVN